MSSAGLTDFGRPVPDCPGLYQRFEEPDGFAVEPAGISIRVSPSGLPELAITIFGSLVGESYGMLEIGFDVTHPVDEGLIAARRLRAAADVRAVAWSNASLWLDVSTIDVDWTAAGEALAAGLGGGHVLHRLTTTDAEFLAGLFTGASSALGALDAHVPAIVSGVAARMDTVVSFDPAKLVADLAERAATGNVFDESATRGLIHDLPDWLHAEPAVVDRDRDHLAAAMLDRIRARFATWDPFLPAPARGGFTVADPATVGSGEVTWSLGEPVVVPRPVRLDLDRTSFAAVIDGISDRTSLVSKVIAPGIDFGVKRLHVYSRVARPRVGVLAVGATLRAPADPPHRPQDIVQSADLSETDEADLTIDGGAPGTSPFLVRGYAVLGAADGAHRIDGPERAVPGDWVVLGPDDFPVDIAVVEASPAVLTLGEVRVHVDRPPLDPIDAELTSTNPRAALVSPRPQPGSMPPQVIVSLSAPDGSQTLSLAPLPFENVRVDLPGFRSFGPQTVSVTATAFRPAMPLLLVELQSEAGGDVSIVRLTPDQPTKLWTYFAASPFTAGYHFRLHPEPSMPEMAWSAVQPAGQPITVAPVAAAPASVAEDVDA